MSVLHKFVCLGVCVCVYVIADVDRGAVVARIQVEAARKRTVHATVCVAYLVCVRVICVCVNC